MKYYVYEYLRKDNTPYYVGKGTNSRKYQKQGHTVPLPSKDRIRVVAENLTNEEAIQLEIELIAKHGRKDLGTGILRNLTNGGEGSSGRLVSENMKQKISLSLMGREQSEETKRKRADALRGKKRTEEQRQRQREAAKNRWAKTDDADDELRRDKIRKARERQVIITTEVTCPHCGKKGGNRIMPRYHFDNCKKRDNNEIK